MIVYLVGDEFLVVPGDGLKQTVEVLLGPHLVAVNLEERLSQCWNQVGLVMMTPVAGVNAGKHSDFTQSF